MKALIIRSYRSSRWMRKLLPVGRGDWPMASLKSPGPSLFKCVETAEEAWEMIAGTDNASG